MNIKNFFIAYMFSLIVFIGSVTNANILDDSKEYNGHYYKIFDHFVSWDDAKRYCESMGGHLATAETKDENDFITQLVTNANLNEYGYWIGGYQNENGVWRWVTGEMISYSNWHISFPVKMYSNKEKGMAISQYYRGPYKALKWHNDNSHCGIICEWDSKDLAHESNL